jgi:hypothetical protein
MTRIICDTMIWYELSKNRLATPDPDRYKLVCTYLSLMELAFTPNNFRDLGEVQDVVKKIFECEPEIILTYPLNYALTLIDTDFKPEYKIEDDIVLGFLQVLLNHPKEGLVDNKFKQQLTDITSKRKTNSSDWADFLNGFHKPSKEVKRIIKNIYTEKDYKIQFRNRFLFQLGHGTGKSYSLDMINWRDFEFYEKVNERYDRNLDISGMKADMNDDNDLKNMIYVQPDDKYWTLEKRWLSIIKEIKLDNYLYAQPDIV